MIKRYKCVVVANGLFPTGQQALELLRQAEFVVACDGAVIGLENGRLPDAVVGDLDSLPEPVRNRYSDRIHRVKDQETNAACHHQKKTFPDRIIFRFLLFRIFPFF